MEISVEQLRRAAAEAALECRLKDDIIAALQAENTTLRARLETAAEEVPEDVQEAAERAAAEQA